MVIRVSLSCSEFPTNEFCEEEKWKKKFEAFVVDSRILKKSDPSAIPVDYYASNETTCRIWVYLVCIAM